MTSRSMLAQEAAAYLGASVDQVRRWTRKGRLNPEKPYGKHGVSLYDTDDLELFKAAEAAEDQVVPI